MREGKEMIAIKFPNGDRYEGEVIKIALTNETGNYIPHGDGCYTDTSGKSYQCHYESGTQTRIVEQFCIGEVKDIIATPPEQVSPKPESCSPSDLGLVNWAEKLAGVEQERDKKDYCRGF